MQKIITTAFLVLYICSAYCQTAPAHLKYYGFYLINTGIDDPNDGVLKTNYTDEVADFTSLNQACAYTPTQNISADVNSMNAACTKPFVAIEQIFFRRVDSNAPSGNNYDVYPDWQTRWNTFKATNAASLTADKIGCLYVIDEPLWNGITFAELSTITQVIKGDYPGIPLFYVEASPELARMQIPTSVDWVGFDQYTVFNPATNASYLANLAMLKSKRSNNQKIFIISETQWIPFYATLNVTPAAMAATVQSYYELAASDPDVIGILGYVWPGGFGDRNNLGARNLPQAVMDELKRQGRLIKANYSPCVDSEPPTVPTDLGATAITKTSFTLSWAASTDNVAVTGYEVFKDGQFYGATTGTSLSITGLACATAYGMTVRAFDHPSPPHNSSAPSAVKSVTTSACDVGAPLVFDGLYTLEARHSGKLLEVSGASSQEAAPVVQWSATGRTSQQWRLTATGNGYYKLTAQHSGKALAVAGNGLSDGASVQQLSDNGSSGQRWKIEPTSNDYYRLTAECSDKVLDVAGGPGATANGALLNQLAYANGTNQQWKLTLVAGAGPLATRTALASLASLSAYPNPSLDGRPLLRLTAAKAQAATVFVHDALGRTHTRLDLFVAAGSTDAALSQQRLPPGLYFLQTMLDGQLLRCTLRVE